MYTSRRALEREKSLKESLLLLLFKRRNCVQYFPKVGRDTWGLTVADVWHPPPLPNTHTPASQRGLMSRNCDDKRPFSALRAPSTGWGPRDLSLLVRPSLPPFFHFCITFLNKYSFDLTFSLLIFPTPVQIVGPFIDDVMNIDDLLLQLWCCIERGGAV